MRGSERAAGSGPGRCVLARSLLALPLALLAAACSIGGNSDATGTPVPTQAEQVTATAAVSPTAQPARETATPTVRPTRSPAPTATVSPTPTASPTPTVTSTPTPEIVELPFGSVARPETTLTNYTVAYTAEFTGGGATEDGTIDLLIEQSAPDAYHLLIRSEGAAASLTEYWFVAGRAYFRGVDGQVFEVTGSVDPSTFSPSAFLITVPSVTGIPRAERGEVELVEGRETTYYSVEAEDTAQFAAPQDGSGFNNPEGELEVWIDNQQNFVAQMSANLSWTDNAGGDHSMAIEYRVSRVGSTPQVNPPI